MTALRIAVAGAGAIGRQHIALVQASTECALAAISDPAPAASDVARTANVPLYPSLDALLAHERVEGVIVATPNDMHVANGIACIDAGVAALIEKPVAHTVEQGERLLAAASRANARVLVGHHRQHSPIMRRARQVVEDGLLGRIVAVTGSAMFYKPDGYFDDAPWRSRPGGGPILINLIHEIGNMRALCGEIVAVQALSSNAIRGFPVEDTVAINLRFGSGALGSFMLSDTAASARSWEQTSRENPSYATYPDEDCYLIAGTDGSLAIPTLRLKRYAGAEDRSWWKPFQTSVLELQRADPLAAQLAHFCAVIRGDAMPLVSIADGLQNLRVTEAIARAAAHGIVVDTLP